MMARFAHDGCPACRFIGMIDDEDIWVCRETLMRRYGDEPHEYQSMPTFAFPSLPEGDEANKWRAVARLVEQSNGLGEILRDGVTPEAMDAFSRRYGFGPYNGVLAASAGFMRLWDEALDRKIHIE